MFCFIGFFALINTIILKAPEENYKRVIEQIKQDNEQVDNLSNEDIKKVKDYLLFIENIDPSDFMLERKDVVRVSYEVKPYNNSSHKRAVSQIIDITLYDNMGQWVHDCIGEISIVFNKTGLITWEAEYIEYIYVRSTIEDLKLLPYHIKDK